MCLMWSFVICISTQPTFPIFHLVFPQQKRTWKRPETGTWWMEDFRTFSRFSLATFFLIQIFKTSTFSSWSTRAPSLSFCACVCKCVSCCVYASYHMWRSWKTIEKKQLMKATTGETEKTRPLEHGKRTSKSSVEAKERQHLWGASRWRWRKWGRRARRATTFTAASHLVQRRVTNVLARL